MPVLTGQKMGAPSRLREAAGARSRSCDRQLDPGGLGAGLGSTGPADRGWLLDNTMLVMIFEGGPWQHAP